MDNPSAFDLKLASSSLSKVAIASQVDINTLTKLYSELKIFLYHFLMCDWVKVFTRHQPFANLLPTLVLMEARCARRGGAVRARVCERDAWVRDAGKWNAAERLLYERHWQRRKLRTFNLYFYFILVSFAKHTLQFWLVIVFFFCNASFLFLFLFYYFFFPPSFRFFVRFR